MRVTKVLGLTAVLSLLAGLAPLALAQTQTRTERSPAKSVSSDPNAEADALRVQKRLM